MIDSHLDVLKKIIAVKPTPTVLEFGCGMYSTPLLYENCREITCIEMQNESWYEKMKSYLEQQNEPDKWLIHCMIGPLAYRNLNLNDWYSLIMVDGHGDSRWQVINDMFSKTDLMVVHDTEEPGYQWEKVEMPKNWMWKDFKEYKTWTAIVTSDTNLLNKL